ncbi:hypothetical protein [uncultured Friedmanniella sp.]|uniref:hypothetical protein n=1 Tax=uncultured Friedmanniella sp. TaxID=335381 RepID=UPI0035CC28CA
MTQNTVLESQGDFPVEPASGAVPPSTSVPLTLDPVQSLTEAWYRQPESAFAVPVRRPFDAQYWACWLVAVLFPVLVAYLLLTR